MDNVVSMAELAKTENHAVKKSWGGSAWKETLAEQVAAAFSDIEVRNVSFVMENVVVEVSTNTGVSVRNIMGRSKVNRVARARQFSMWKLLNMDFSIFEVAAFFKRDRATVHHAKARIDKMMETGE